MKLSIKWISFNLLQFFALNSNTLLVLKCSLKFRDSIRFHGSNCCWNNTNLNTKIHFNQM